MKPIPPSSRLLQGMVVRWNRAQLIQHGLLLASGFLLGFTGLAQKFHDLRLAGRLIRLLGGVEINRDLHRAGAVILILAVLYHLAQIAATEYGHQEFMRIKLKLQDFRDLVQALRFNLGSAPSPPRTAKYGYQEKFHYWAVVAVVLLMIPTGLVLCFENQAMMILPKWIYDVTVLVHGGSGLFFFAVVVLSHLYSVHLNPRVFHLDWMWLTGTVSEEQLQAQHPLEYEQIKKSAGR